MKARMDFRKATPEAVKAMGELHAFVHRCGPEPGLLELVKLRASHSTPSMKKTLQSS
jgi:hypothetical protein